MRPAARCLIALCAGLVFSAGCAQIEPRTPPRPMRNLSDEAGALTEAQDLELSRALLEAFELTGVRIVTVILRSTAPESVEDYADRLARRLARKHAIDPERTVFVIAAIGDREMQILPGRALRLDTELTDPEIARDLAPLLRERRYFEALMILTARIRDAIRNNRPGRAQA